MKGLAISNSSLVQKAHNSLARPADIRSALHAAVKVTALANTSSSSSRRPKSTPEGKKPDVKQKQKMKDEGERVETYHFIGYVPAHGKGITSPSFCLLPRPESPVQCGNSTASSLGH
jgi:ubiquitin carboxyl-terminal hydrolase L5